MDIDKHEESHMTDIATIMLKKLDETLPSIFARKAIPKLFGGVISIGTLANLGENGPPYTKTARHAVYEKESFLRWFATQIK